MVPSSRSIWARELWTTPGYYYAAISFKLKQCIMEGALKNQEVVVHAFIPTLRKQKPANSNSVEYEASLVYVVSSWAVSPMWWDSVSRRKKKGTMYKTQDQESDNSNSQEIAKTYKIHKTPPQGYTSNSNCWGERRWVVKLCPHCTERHRDAAFMSQHSC